MSEYTLPEPAGTVQRYDSEGTPYSEPSEQWTEAQMQAAFTAGAASRTPEVEALQAQVDASYKHGFADGLKEAPEGFPTMQDALNAGDGVLHGAIDALQARVKELEKLLLAKQLANRSATTSLIEELGKVQAERDALAAELAAARAHSLRFAATGMAWRDAPTKTEWGNGMMVADIELSKDETATIFAHKDALPLQVIEQPAHDLGLAIGAGAVYDFAGFLTTRDKQLTLSSKDDAAPCAEAVKEFLDKRGIPDSLRPDIEGWATNSQPAQPVHFSPGVTVKVRGTTKELPVTGIYDNTVFVHLEQPEREPLSAELVNQWRDQAVKEHKSGEGLPGFYMRLCQIAIANGTKEPGREPLTVERLRTLEQTYVKTRPGSKP